MNEPILRIALRHMENSPEIQMHIDRQMARIIDFLGNEPTPIYIDLVATPSKVHEHHEVELIIKSPNYNVIVKKEGPIFFQVLDIVTDEAYQKLQQENRRLTDDHKEGRLNKKNKVPGEYNRKQRFQKK